MDFLQEMFQYKPENLWILVWSLANKESHWFRSASEAQEFAKGRPDTYFGVSLSPKNWGSNQRCPSGKSAGIVAMWSDIDTYHPVAHKKENLPKTYEEARALIATPTPTCIVHSGHGIQAWWMFDEPWIFENDADREDAMQMSSAWSGMIRARAEQIGQTADGVGDLARVMRIPGTVNAKTSTAANVKIVEQSGKKYTVEELKKVIERERPEDIVDRVKPRKVTTVVFQDDANPPTEKLEALMENDRKFKQSWNRKRTDLKDQSASSYDLSLATIAMRCGWTDQEITNLLIASRRKHGDHLKREDYYERTIAAAGRNRSQEEAIAALSNEVEENVDVLSNASRVLGIDITRLVYYTSEPPGFRLETAKGDVVIGENILELRAVKKKFLLYAKHMLPNTLKQRDWETIVTALMNITVDEDLGSESTSSGAFVNYMNIYLSSHRPNSDEEGVREAIQAQAPYIDGEDLVFFGPSFRKWLSMSQGERMTHKELGMMIRSAGGFPDKVWHDKSTRGIWRIPAADFGY